RLLGLGPGAVRGRSRRAAPRVLADPAADDLRRRRAAGRAALLIRKTTRREIVMANELQGKKIAFIATEGVEQVELTEPWKAVEQAGAQPELISMKGEEFHAWKHFDKGDSFEPDKTAEEAQIDDYDGLVLPGGVANPDQLCTDENVVSFIRDFAATGKPIGVICHGPWTLIEAGVLKGR